MQEKAEDIVRVIHEENPNRAVVAVAITDAGRADVALDDGASSLWGEGQ